MFSGPNFELSLNGTVLTASWNPFFDAENISYTFSCSVNGTAVLVVETTETSLVIGIYKHNSLYTCILEAYGDIELATDYVTTGGS